MLTTFQENLLNPVFLNIAKLLTATLDDLRKVNFDAQDGSSTIVCSPLVSTLQEQLRFFIKNILQLFSQSNTVQEKCKALVQRVGFYYLDLVWHLKQTMGEVGKLRLAADMTQVEFALCELCEVKEVYGESLSSQYTLGQASLEKYFRSVRASLFT